MTYDECVRAACQESLTAWKLIWVYEMLDGDYQWRWADEPQPQKASRKAARIYRGRVTAKFSDTI